MDAEKGIRVVFKLQMMMYADVYTNGNTGRPAGPSLSESKNGNPSDSVLANPTNSLYQRCCAFGSSLAVTLRHMLCGVVNQVDYNDSPQRPLGNVFVLSIERLGRNRIRSPDVP